MTDARVPGGPARPAGSARPSRRKRPRSRAVFLTQVVVVAVLAFAVAGLVVYIGSLGLTYDTARKSASNVQVFPSAGVRPSPAPTSGPGANAQNILLIGTNGAGGTAPTVAELTSEQADTMLLLHIPADGRHAYVLSLQKNTWLSVPGHGMDTAGDLLTDGGLPLTVRVVEGLTGVRVDHVAVVSYAGFSGLTTALGGVSVDNPVAFSRDGFAFAHGRIALNGPQAQAFVRTGDTSTLTVAQQVRAQQAYLSGVLGKLLSAGTLLNPVTLHNTVAAISPYLLVDRGLDAGAIANLTLELRSLRASDVVFLTMPVGSTATQDGQAVVRLDPAKLAQLATDLQHDTLGQYRP